ncbi:hypothetical protein Tco_0411610 [Tanacetum coccineum]
MSTSSFQAEKTVYTSLTLFFDTEQTNLVNGHIPVVEQDEHNMIIDSLDMSYDREKVDQDDDDLAKERDLLASLIEKLKCEIDDSKKNRVILTTSVSRPQLKSNQLEDRVMPNNIQWKKQEKKIELIEIILFIVDSGCSKHMTGNLKLLSNFVEKFLGTVKFGNDQIASILGYGDLVQGNITIKRVYYVEGLNHNLFSVGQFCDADLKVAFQKSTCYIHDLKGNDLLTSSRGADLYSITLKTHLLPIQFA